MSLLWRLFAPKPLRKARRTVWKATHPLNAVTPRPIRRARRTAWRATHPGEAVENAIANEVVRAARRRRRRRRW